MGPKTRLRGNVFIECDANMAWMVLDPQQVKFRVAEYLSKDPPRFLALLSSTRARHERDLDVLHHISGG